MFACPLHMCPYASVCHVHMCLRVCMCSCTCVSVCIHVSVYVCVRVHPCVRVHVRPCACMRVRVHACEALLSRPARVGVALPGHVRFLLGRLSHGLCGPSARERPLSVYLAPPRALGWCPVRGRLLSAPRAVRGLPEHALASLCPLADSVLGRRSDFYENIHLGSSPPFPLSDALCRFQTAGLASLGFAILRHRSSLCWIPSLSERFYM